MNIINTGGINPTDQSVLNQKMQSIAGRGAATVKTSKDAGKTAKEDALVKEEDVFVPTQEEGEPTESQKQAAGDRSGVVSEQAKNQKKRSADELKMFGGKHHKMKLTGAAEEDFEAQADKAADAGISSAETAKSDEITKLDGEQLQINAKVNEILERDPQEIMDASPKVPEGLASTAKDMVLKKIENGTPNESLKKLKEVPDQTLIENSDIEIPISILPIHESKNKPMAMEAENLGEAPMPMTMGAEVGN